MAQDARNILRHFGFRFGFRFRTKSSLSYFVLRLSCEAYPSSFVRILSLIAVTGAATGATSTARVFVFVLVFVTTVSGTATLVLVFALS